MIEEPYRDSKEPLRDTGHEPKIPDEKEHMSSARVFDTLCETNMALVRMLKPVIIVMVSFGLLATMMTGFSALILRAGQQETRDLIIAISKQPKCGKD